MLYRIFSGRAGMRFFLIFFVRVGVWWIMRRGYFLPSTSTFYFLITVGKGRDELDSVEEELDV